VRPSLAAAALLLALAQVPAVPAAAAAPDEKPFPVPDRSVILREEGTVYLVEGRVRIPRGVEVSCQKDIYIRAKGKDPAFLVVEGDFKAHGVGAREIIFEGVTVEPAPEFGKIQLDSCIFRKGGGLATPKDGSAEGEILLQFCRFQDRARCDLALSGTSLQVLDSSTSGPLRIRGADAPGKPNRLKAVVRGGTFQGMEARSVADLTVRINSLRSDPLLFVDLPVLVFDGNKVEGKELRIEHSRAGGFAKTQVMKCDLYPKTLSFRAPADAEKSDALVLDKCWFEGITDPKAIAERIRDAADDPGNGVKVTVQNPQERPLELAGTLNR
jgi:hypothetical protein